MPFTIEIAKSSLDWVTGNAATRPGARFISFATASPRSDSAFDGPFSPRQTCTFAAANSPQMSATNLNAMAGATATAVGTVVGWNLWNSNVGGTRLAYGTATAAIGCASGDNVSIAAGALKIVLS